MNVVRSDRDNDGMNSHTKCLNSHEKEWQYGMKKQFIIPGDEREMLVAAPVTDGTD